MNIRPIGSLAIALPLFAGVSLFGQSPTKLKPPTPEQLKSAADKGDWRACNNYAVKNPQQALKYLEMGERSFLDEHDTDKHSHRILTYKEHKDIEKNLQTEYPLLFFNLGTLYRKKGKYREAGRCLLIASQPDSPVATSARNDYGVLLAKGLIEPLVDWQDFSFGFEQTEEEKKRPKGKPGQIPLQWALKSKFANHDRSATAKATYNLGVLETDRRKAGGLISRARDIDPKLPPLKPLQTQAEINYEFGRTKLEQGKLEEAIKPLNKALRESKKGRHSNDATIEAEIMKLAKQFAEAEGKSFRTPKENSYIKQIKHLFLKDWSGSHMYPESNIYLCYACFLRIENHHGNKTIHTHKRIASEYFENVNQDIANGPNHKSTWEKIQRMNLKHRHVPHPLNTPQPIKPDTTGIFHPAQKELNSLVGGLINDGLDYMNFQRFNVAIDKFKQAEGAPTKTSAQTQKIHKNLASAYYKLRSQRMKIGRKLEKEEEKELLSYALKAAAGGDVSSRWFVADIQQKSRRKDPNYKNYLISVARDGRIGGPHWKIANELYKRLVTEKKTPFSEEKDRKDLKRYLMQLSKQHNFLILYPFIKEGLRMLEGTRL